MRKPFVLLLIALSSAFPFASRQARADNYTFGLIPSGDVIGTPGSTVGWGYSITNDSSGEWLVTSGLSADPFENGIASSIFDFPDLAPGATIMVPFTLVRNASCAVPPCGLYDLTWDPSAPLGFANTGAFTLSAQWWTGDPLHGGKFITDATDGRAGYSAIVVPTPEPSTILLLLGGLGGIAFRVRNRRTP